MNKQITLLISFLAIPGLTMAQEEGQNMFEQYQLEIVVGFALLVCLVALLALIVAWWGLKSVYQAQMADKGLEDDVILLKARPGEEHMGFWGRLWNRMNAPVPIEQEETVATDHAYDGIRELDNRLPPWWLYGFYITIIFGVIYWVHYEVLGTGLTQAEEYEVEMAQAEADVQAYLASLDNLLDETNVEHTTDQVDLSEGEAIYAANCAVCHAADGGGGVGPNFTDKYWLHGGDIKSIFKTVKYGIPEKGMISWESQLSPKQMQQVSSFIYEMEGTTPEQAKDPQGELFEREEAPAEETETEES